MRAIFMAPFARVRRLNRQLPGFVILMKHAFSLVELLVVVSIIALLAAILFPVFSRVRENGRRAACQSNLKQIGYGLIQYSQDYDEILVADWYGTSIPIGSGDTLPPGSTDGVSYKWEDAVFPYVKNEQVFNCPSATDKAATPYHYYKTLTRRQPSDELGSYIIMHGYGPPTSQQAYPPCDGDKCTPPVSHLVTTNGIPHIVSLARAQTPSNTAWVLDGNGEFFCSVDGPHQQINADLIVPRHLETIGVLFLDGHVKNIRRDVLNKPNANGILPMATLQDD